MNDNATNPPTPAQPEKNKISFNCKSRTIAVEYSEWPTLIHFCLAMDGPADDGSEDLQHVLSETLMAFNDDDRPLLVTFAGSLGAFVSVKLPEGGRIGALTARALFQKVSQAE